jgi:hypothetical protein
MNYVENRILNVLAAADAPLWAGEIYEQDGMLDAEQIIVALRNLRKSNQIQEVGKKELPGKGAKPVPLYGLADYYSARP